MQYDYFSIVNSSAFWNSHTGGNFSTWQMSVLVQIIVLLGIMCSINVKQNNALTGKFKRILDNPGSFNKWIYVHKPLSEI